MWKLGAYDSKIFMIICGVVCSYKYIYYYQITQFLGHPLFNWQINWVTKQEVWK